MSVDSLFQDDPETEPIDYFAHLESLRGLPTLERVLQGEKVTRCRKPEPRTLVHEVEDFYNVRGRYELLAGDESKNGQLPEELTLILKPFSRYDLDAEKMPYGAVREALQRQEPPHRSSSWKFWTALSMGVGGMLTFPHMPTTGIAMIGGGVMLYFLQERHQETTPAALRAYNELWSAAYSAQQTINKIRYNDMVAKRIKKH